MKLAKLFLIVALLVGPTAKASWPATFWPGNWVHVGTELCVSYGTLPYNCGYGSYLWGNGYGVTYPYGWWPNYWVNQERYAAIAYASDGSGKYGTSWNWPYATQASNQALNYCADGSCKIVAWSRNGCVSLAANPANKGQYGYAWGQWRSDVTQRAVSECNRLHHAECNTVVSVCNGW